MLQRNIKITFRLNQEEHKFLANQIKKTGLSQQALIRALIRGYEPRELPPLDYYAIVRELHVIGINLNLIAARANATGNFDKDVFKSDVNWLRPGGASGGCYWAENKSGGGMGITICSKLKEITILRGTYPTKRMPNDLPFTYIEI